MSFSKNWCVRLPGEGDCPTCQVIRRSESRYGSPHGYQDPGSFRQNFRMSSAFRRSPERSYRHCLLTLSGHALLLFLWSVLRSFWMFPDRILQGPSCWLQIRNVWFPLTHRFLHDVLSVLTLPEMHQLRWLLSLQKMLLRPCFLYILHVLVYLLR